MTRSTRIGAVTAVAIGLLLGGASAHGATSPAGHLRYAIDSWAKFPDLMRTAHRHDYVILHAWQQAKMREIKAADPDTGPGDSGGGAGGARQGSGDHRASRHRGRGNRRTRFQEGEEGKIVAKGRIKAATPRAGAGLRAHRAGQPVRGHNDPRGGNSAGRRKPSEGREGARRRALRGAVADLPARAL